MHTQRFRLGNETLDLEVVQGSDGKFFCPWQNIQDTFPGATVFEVKKVRVFPMTDENGNRYEPKRIRHYPDDIIEVVTSQDHVFLNHHDKSGTMAQPRTNIPSSTPYLNQTTSTSVPFKDPSVSTLNISLSQLSTTDIALANSSPQPHVTLYPSTTPLSILTANIAELRHELVQHSDSQSTRHIQLTEQLFHLLQQQSEMLQKQAEMLQEQAEAKRRDEEHERMLQQSIDRMVILQRGVDAVLVQNYELHEYPIPRLFVILPEKIANKVIKNIERSNDNSKSFSGSEEKDEDQEGSIDTIKSLDPRNLLEDKFRLYFLCECGDHSSTESDTATSYDQASAHPTVNIKNKVHLAKHEGYQLSRPTQFLKQYGPYIMGMLQILKFCLDVAKFVAPAVGIAQDSLQKTADSVKSASEHTLEAVNISINFLETKLGGDINLDSQGDNGIGGDIFKNLAALEGADLRQLETFLRNKDKDKILGNLYRTTTSEGHVKWVCLEHFKTSYRENAMGSFLNTIEVNHGIYNKQLKKITLVLSSSTMTKDLMKQLVTYTFAVDELDLTLDFGFGSPDLTRIVEGLAQSNVKALKLNLKDTEGIGRLDIKMPGKGKYHPLLGLMSNRKLQQLSLTGMDYFGTRTSDLSKYHAQSTLRSFHHLNYIRSSDIPRLVNILSFCTNLVDLRLGSCYHSRSHPDLRRAIGNLKQLEVLHLIRLVSTSDDVASDDVTSNEGYRDGVLLEIETAGIKLRELVVIGYTIFFEDVSRAAHAFESTLEILIVNEIRVGVDLQSPRFKYEHGFPKLTRLETRLDENQETIQLLCSKLDHRLTHLGTIRDERTLTNIANFKALRSVTIREVNAGKLLPLWKSFPENGGSSQIECLSLQDIQGYAPHAHLMAISLRKLWVTDIRFLIGLSTTMFKYSSVDRSSKFLTGLLKSLVLSKLEILAVHCRDEAEVVEVEEVMAARQDDFPEQLMIHLLFRSNKGQTEGESDFKMMGSKGTVTSINMSGLEQRNNKKLDPLRVKGYLVYDDSYLHYQLMSP